MFKVFGLVGVMVALAAGPSGAQGPSADDIIRSLRPTSPMGGTRGIRPVGPPGDPPAEASPGGEPRAGTNSGPARRAPAPVARPAPSVDLTVQFATNSVDLTPAATGTLDQLGRALSSSVLGGYRFRIEGHTDTVGTREANRTLSEQRAAKVLDYLVATWRVERSRVETAGLGQDRLIVRTGPGVEEPRNRRVTVINLGP